MKKTLHVLLLVLSCGFFGLTVSVSAIGTGLVVTNTNDNGVGSLRYAIEVANESEGHDTISFNIQGDGSHTIRLKESLPQILETVTIDATTQPNAQCNASQQTLMIELNGQDAGERVTGITILGQDVVIRGLAINGFSRHGIEILSLQGGSRIECNFIGTDVTGTIAQGNRRAGVVMNHSPFNTIGSVIPGMGNVISGNRQDGVVIIGRDAVQNTVIANLIGTDITGSEALGNANIGVFIDNASHNYIGGTDEQSRNIISGNGWEGIFINDSSAVYNIIAGNYIGTDITGSHALGNSDSGIVISQASHNLIGGADPGAANVISANGRQGIYIFAETANDNTVIGNLIGTDAKGTKLMGNIGSGVFLDQTLSNTVGGDEPEHRNLITGNGEYGIYVYGFDWIDEHIKFNTFGENSTDQTVSTNGLGDVHVDSADKDNDA